MKPSAVYVVLSGLHNCFSNSRPVCVSANGETSEKTVLTRGAECSQCMGWCSQCMQVAWKKSRLNTMMKLIQ